MSGPYRSSYLQYNFKLYIQSRCSLQNKNTAQFFKWARDLNMHLPKTVTQMEDKCMRRCSTSFIIQFSHSVLSDSLWPHKPQHTRPPCSSPTAGVYPNHVHWVRDAIQPPHALSSPSPPALKLSQHQGLFKWVSFLRQVAKVLEFQLQHQPFQWTPWTDLL